MGESTESLLTQVCCCLLHADLLVFVAYAAELSGRSSLVFYHFISSSVFDVEVIGQAPVIYGPFTYTQFINGDISVVGVGRNDILAI